MDLQSSQATELEQLWGSWTSRMNNLYEDPNVSKLMNTSVGQYLLKHPLLALTAVTFSVVAMLPVGLFLTFAMVTIIMSTVGFVVFEGRCNRVRSTNVSRHPVLVVATANLSILSFRIPAVCRRVVSAVCSFWPRPLLSCRFTGLPNALCHRLQNPHSPTCGRAK